MFRRFTGLKHLHFAGIGGAGMSGIAEILLDYGLEVSGCDQASSETTERLASLGARIYVGHSSEHLDDVDLLVVSSALPQDNPEIVAARERGVTVVRRAEMLAELMRLKYGIAIAGTHGKTTTTSLAGTLLTEAGLDPTVIVGGRLRVSGTGARHGKSRFLVAEADEFNRSFLRLAPVLAVVTSIDRDHLDTYGSEEKLTEAFVSFASRVPFFGQVILCLDDPGVQKILPALADRRVVTYGLTAQAELAAREVVYGVEGSRFVVHHAVDGTLGTVELPMPGPHNVQNALAAIAIGLALELDFSEIAKGLAAFSGVHRRFELLGQWLGAAVVDDYAHHPTEVAAVLKAARQAYPTARIHAVLQPHLYSRTRDLADAFGRSLLGADVAVVTDVYASREAPIPGVSGELVVEAARSCGHRQVESCPLWGDAADLLRQRVEPGDLVLTLGAGDIYRLGRELVAEETG